MHIYRPLCPGVSFNQGRPFLLPGARNALGTTEHAETQKMAISRPRPGDPLTMSHFEPPDSIRRRVGRPCLEGGPGPRYSGRSLPGSQTAFGTTENAETQKIAISKPRPGDPLMMSCFGPPDSIRRRVARPSLEGGPQDFPGQPSLEGRRAIYQGCVASSPGTGRATVKECPFTRAVWLHHGGQGGPLSKSALLPGVSGFLHRGRRAQCRRGFAPRVWPLYRGQGGPL